MQLPKIVFHLAEAANWPSIERNGLLPTSLLLQQAFPQRRGVDAIRRPTHTVLPTGVHVRDQGPMPERALSGCLVGMSPAQWYQLINAHVFFWLDPDRLNRQRAACGPRPQVVAEVRTEDLLARHAEQAFVTPFNTGYALRKPARRGHGTFVPYYSWVDSGWVSEAQATGGRARSRAHQAAELVVRGAVPDFLNIVSKVTRLAPQAHFFHGAP